MASMRLSSHAEAMVWTLEIRVCIVVLLPAHPLSRTHQNTHTQTHTDNWPVTGNTLTSNRASKQLGNPKNKFDTRASMGWRRSCTAPSPPADIAKLNRILQDGFPASHPLAMAAALSTTVPCQGPNLSPLTRARAVSA